jgi:hypothetical protein
MTDDFDIDSWASTSLSSRSHHRSGPHLALCHICRVCQRPRSRRYHYEHPIPYDGVPPPPGICRRCRVVPAEDIASVGTMSDAKASDEEKNHSGQSSSKGEVMRSHGPQILQNSQAVREKSAARPNDLLNLSYRHINMRKTFAKSTRREHTQPDTDLETDDPENTDDSAVLISPTRKGIAVSSLRSTAKSGPPKTTPEPMKVTSIRGVAELASLQRERGMSYRSDVNDSLLTKRIDAAVQTEVRQQITREVQRIAREETARYNRESIKEFESPKHDERMRRIARDEVEKYRRVERKMDAHGHVYAHGKMVPIERSSIVSRKSARDGQDERSRSTVDYSSSRQPFCEAVEDIDDRDPPSVWQSGKRSGTHETPMSRILRHEASTNPMRSDTIRNNGNSDRQRGVVLIDERIQLGSASAPTAAPSWMTNDQFGPANDAQRQTPQTEARDRDDRDSVRDPVKRVQSPLQKARERSSLDIDAENSRFAKASLDRTSLDRIDGLARPVQRLSPSDGPDALTRTLWSASVQAVVSPSSSETSALAVGRRKSTTRPMARLYYRPDDPQRQTSYRRGAQNSHGDDSGKERSQVNGSIRYHSEYNQMSARRNSSDHYLQSETDISRRQPSQTRFSDDHESSVYKRKSRLLASRPDCDTRSQSRDSVPDDANKMVEKGDDQARPSKTRPHNILPRKPSHVDQGTMRAANEAVPSEQDRNRLRPGMLGPYTRLAGKPSESVKVQDGSVISEDSSNTSRHHRRRRERN